MTIKQLITELEKRGVLTIEPGDLCKQREIQFIVTRVEKDGSDISLYIIQNGKDIDCLIEDGCTHSADDPRLLGRVLRELDSDLLDIGFYRDEVEIALMNCSETKREKGNFESMAVEETKTTGDTLLEAALKALLSKVEGEKK